MEIETLLVDEAAAQAEGGRRLGLYGVHREALTIGIDIADADDLQPGMTVEVVVDRYGYGEGKVTRIIGREDDFAADKAILTLWG